MISTILWISIATRFLQKDSIKEIDAIIARAARPQPGDKEKIARFGDTAFPRIYSKVRPWLGMELDASQDSKLRSRLIYLIDCASIRRTPEMGRLLSKARWWQKGWIFDWLATKGDPRLNRRLFESEFAVENSQMKQRAAQGLGRIGDDQAIQFLGKLLVKAREHPEVERAICWNLAATEKPAALEFVRRALYKGTKLPPISQRLAAPKGESILSIASDPSGKKWALVKWAGLGAPEDLWIVHAQDGKWVDPIFTGVSAYWPYALPSGRPTEGYEKHDAEMKVLIEKKDWVTKFVGNSDLTRDSDHDGYTDVVENWLGLDPNNADTDGDGILDGVDKNPFAAPHNLSDQDRAIQSAVSFLCLSRGAANENKIIDFPQGVNPLEIESCTGPAFAKKPSMSGKVFGRWITISAGTKATNEQRSEFLVPIRESGGYYETGYEIRVKRIGEEWFVIQQNVKWSAVS